MKYIVFDRGAAESMVLQRELFSVEFTQALDFITILRGENIGAFNIDDVFCHKTIDGLYMLGRTSEVAPQNGIDLFVIDCDQSKLFYNITKEQDMVQIIQKILRFCCRYWNGHGFPHSEKILTDTPKAVLFPFPFSTSSNYKLVIERDVDSARGSKRGMGRTLLLYKANYANAPTGIENPTLTNFRAACSEYNNVLSISKDHFVAFDSSSVPEPPPIPIKSFILNDAEKHSSMCMSFDQWLKKLSTPQSGILDASLKHPVKIQGAAGTGKTLTLILKALHELKKAKKENRAFRTLFLTHSNATQEQISYVMRAIDGNEYWYDKSNKQSVTISTLYHIFLDMLKSDVSASDILENDALDAKLLQQMYIDECLKNQYDILLNTSRGALSPDFLDFITHTNRIALTSMLMHEFAIQLKGRSSGDLENYQKLPPLDTGLPTRNSADKFFIFRIFEDYQAIFDALGQFDSDDIALSAHSRLNAPIWKRRRLLEGYDLILLDETHLFNFNELQSIHYLTKSSSEIPIVFAMDVAQAIGETIISQDDIVESFKDQTSLESKVMNTVFRGTPEITNLSAAVLASGANIFSSITSLYDTANMDFVKGEIYTANHLPEYFLVDGDDNVLNQSLGIAKSLIKKGTNASDICMILFSDPLAYGPMQGELEQKLGDAQIPYRLLKKRADFLGKTEAKAKGEIILTYPDYVGGLEFKAVVLLGVDKGRVPLHQQDISDHFFHYTAINKLYVSLSRAQKEVYVIGDRNRGISPCFEYALKNEFISIKS